MFTELELEALALGVRWVADRTDPELAHAARQLAAKIAAVLPANLRIYMDSAALLVGPSAHHDSDTASEHLTFKVLRHAIRQETVVKFNYCDLKQVHTQRDVWPFAMGYFDATAILVAWCTRKNDFRHFRIDRISQCVSTKQHYPKRRLDLFTQWQTQANIHPTDRF